MQKLSRLPIKATVTQAAQSEYCSIASNRSDYLKWSFTGRCGAVRHAEARQHSTAATITAGDKRNCGRSLPLRPRVGLPKRRGKLSLFLYSSCQLTFSELSEYPFHHVQKKCTSLEWMELDCIWFQPGYWISLGSFEKLNSRGRAKEPLLSSVTHVPSGLMGCASAALD